ncbi:MAG: hypothetical protein ACRDTH_20465 [Pseudonocardiaceae bacterium]
MSAIKLAAAISGSVATLPAARWLVRNSRDPWFAPYIPGVPIDVDEANNTAMLFLMHGAPMPAGAGPRPERPAGRRSAPRRAAPAPNTLRLDRDANRHVSFAPGSHHCLGAALARLQLEIGLGTLLAGLPTLALAADIHTLDWQHGMLGARNLAALPVTW